MNNKILVEVCVDSLDSAMIAEQGGADRIELCSNLNIGGTTPSIGLIELAKKHLKIEIFVMIRPRGGDFCYTDLEYEVIKQDIKQAKNQKVDGIVIGILKPDGTIDINRMKEIIEIARPLKITFHRAFDKSIDLFHSLKTLIELGVDRVLTSGGENQAMDGIEVIKELVTKSNNKIIIMPGSGVNINNAQEIITYTNVHEIHFSGRQCIESKMKYRNPKINNSGNLIISEHNNFYASKDIIKNLVNKIRTLK